MVELLETLCARVAALEATVKQLQPLPPLLPLNMIRMLRDCVGREKRQLAASGRETLSKFHDAMVTLAILEDDVRRSGYITSKSHWRQLDDAVNALDSEVVTRAYMRRRPQGSEM